MTVYYLDSSAVVKTYLPETGSEWVISLQAQSTADRFVSVELLAVEVACALARAQRSGRTGMDRYENSLALFALDSQNRYELLTVSERVLSRAIALAQRHSLRAYDAIHLAAALDIAAQAHNAGLPPLVFVSADAALLAAARTEGLETENPNEHDTACA